MTNWCSVKMTVKGDSEQIEQFIAAQAGTEAQYGEVAASDPVPLSEFTFNAQVPMPLEVLRRGHQESEPGSISDRDKWVSEHWGTDDVLEFSVRRGEGQAVLWMQTAWSPPVPWFEAVCKLWPKLVITIEFFEPLNGFAGRITKKGAVFIEYSEEEVVTPEFVREMGFSENCISQFFED